MARRDSCELILSYITLKEYSREFQIIIDSIKNYYARDGQAVSINREILLGLLAETVSNKKHLERFTSIVDQALSSNTSAVNIDELILQAKKNEVADKLAVALSNRDDTTKLLEEYTHLANLTSLEELNASGAEILTHEDFGRVLSGMAAGEGRWRLYPLALNERLDGRAGGGHHIVTFARPEMGKTALNLTIAGGFARQGAHGIYFINEDKVEDLYLRLVCNLSGLTLKESLTNPEKAEALARKNGLEFVRIISLAPGTLREVEAFVDKYAPVWVVMDQLRNLSMKEANKVLQLEYATTGMRNIAKKYGALVVSTTQAGDSAEGKALLTMGDVDFSNTGVAAQADVLIGLGATQADQERGIRMLNISKNKLTGRHEGFPVKLIPQLSRYVSMNEADANADT